MGATFIINYRQGNEAWHERILAEGEAVVGRGEVCSLQFYDNEISKTHLKYEGKGLKFG